MELLKRIRKTETVPERRGALAYGPEGRVFLTTDENLVLCHKDHNRAHFWTAEFPARVVGLRRLEANVYACDEQGVIVALDTITGHNNWTVETDYRLRDLAAAATGHWAATTPDRIILGYKEELKSELQIDDVCMLSAERDGQAARFVIGTGDGRLIFAHTDGGRREFTIPDGQPVRAAAALPGRSWLVASGRELYRVFPGLHRRPARAVRRYISTTRMARSLAVSQSGALIACVAGNRIEIYDRRGELLGLLDYPDRQPDEVAFGPKAWLGISLGMGDVNLVDIARGRIHRSEPPPDRPLNTWNVELHLNKTEARDALAVTAARNRAH